MKNAIKTIGAFTFLALLSATPAIAQVDTTFVTGMQADIIAVVTAIGGALLAAGAVAVAFKWGKAALFG